MVLLLTTCALNASAQFNYPDFSSIVGLDLSGTAIQYGNRLRVAPSRQDTRGYATYHSPQTVASGFLTTFDFQYHNFSGGWGGKQGTDGIGLTVRSTTNTDAFSVYFYGIWSPQAGDMSNSRVLVGGAGVPSQRTDVEALGIRFSDGNVNAATVGCDGSNLWVNLNGQQVVSCSGVNLSTYGPSKIGFEGYMGGAMADQDVLNWSFNPAPDTTPPSVAITAPTNQPTYSTTATTVDLAGTASDNIGVTSVSWTNNRGGSGTCTGTTSWSATAIPLQPGDNLITVTATDASSNIATDTLTVNSDQTPPVAAPVQWTVAQGGNGHWYQYVATPDLNWDQAKAAAEASSWQGLQGYLATITSAEENAWIIANIWIAPAGTIWLGGYQDRSASDYSEPGGGWRWVTGETWSYTYWGIKPSTGNEPNNGFYYSKQHEEEDWLAVLAYPTSYTTPCPWNDTTYTDGYSPSQSNSSGYLVEYAPTIPFAKQLPNDPPEPVSLSAKVVTYASADYFYIEEDSRVMGIRVEKTAHGLTVGMRADVTGTMKTKTSRERYILATSATHNGNGTVAPVGMNNMALGGDDWKVVGTGGQKGVTEAIGLNNIGLLVKTWGRFYPIDATTFEVDDGAGLYVKCTVPAGTFLYGDWESVVVTGISSMYRFNSAIYPPNLLVRDIQVLAPVEAVSVPGTPTGNASPLVNVSETYATTGSTCTQGHPVEYSFDWGDGTSSPWADSTSASHSWNGAGTVSVAVTARCKVSTSISATSAGLPVNVVSPYTGQMIYIPAGAFLMGNNGSEPYSYSNELPQHSVDLAGYYITKHEVTRSQYRAFMEAGGYTTQAYWSDDGWNWKVANSRTEPEYWAASQNWGTPPGTFTQTDNHPVVGVTYYEAEAFCNWVGGHLPTEAQWEKAARWDGSHPNVYPWGDAWDAEKCNNYEDTNPAGGGYQHYQTAPVGSYPDGVSPYGCLDMAGNVWEWCQDWYKSYPESTSPFDDTNVRRVIRGGGWFDQVDYSRSAFRLGTIPNLTNGSDVGFRFACNTVGSPPTEIVSVPGTPSGNQSPIVGVSETYTTTGSTCSQGHSIEYSFNWGDGTSSPWSMATTASHAWSTTGNVSITVSARCKVSNSVVATSAGLAVNVLPVEAVSTPGTPTGNQSPIVNTNEEYTTSGSTCNLGHPVEYSFNWGDGTSSVWSTSTTASHAWSTTGSLSVTVSARCAVSNSVSATSTALAISVIDSPYTGEMIFIPAGSFLMGNSGIGNDAAWGTSREYPQHSVYLSEYYIAKCEVTRGDYRKFMDAGGYLNSAYWSADGWSWKGTRSEPQYWAADQNWGNPPGAFTQTDNHPVVGVSYYEAEAFCNWAGGHLPTEAQWEKAARWNPVTSHPNLYPWGDIWDQEKCNNHNDTLYPLYETAPVGSYPSGTSPYGCQDMAGNVWEWCKDWCLESYYSQTPAGGWIDPQGPTSGSLHVFRGADILTSYSGNVCRCAWRNYGVPDYSSDFNLGFRFAR